MLIYTITLFKAGEDRRESLLHKESTTFITMSMHVYYVILCVYNSLKSDTYDLSLKHRINFLSSHYVCCNLCRRMERRSITVDTDLEYLESNRTKSRARSLFGKEIITIE